MSSSGGADSGRDSTERETTAERFRRLEPLLDRALELEGKARDDFIASCAAIYPDLIGDLRRALSLDDTSLPGLGDLAAEAVRDQRGERSTDRRNLRAGPWQLIEKLGRGGMGTVYRAQRADGAFDKQVAVKLLRGQDLRFKDHLERERQLLARLEHPAIARLIDGGVLKDGQPFLVMELAEGHDLDKWCKQKQPSLERRLRVFIDICAAVAEAHSHLIVHRDLKPSNIRVADDDSVKLLDFGIAKLLDPDIKRGETRSVALTPEYAAPEQLDGGVITTRTDVYALGALLYLLLTGRSPHPHFDGNWAAMIEAVCQHDAAPPSQKLRDGTAPFAANELRGDLDAICLKALSRNPQSRYATAETLAGDVERHLDGRPVQARPWSWTYRSSRWFRRNWLAASLGLSAFILLAGAAGLLAWQSHRIATERDAAVLEARRSEAVRNYLLLMFRNAAEQSPDTEQLRARDLLDQSADQIEDVFGSDPITGQAVLSALGELYVLLDDYAGAEPLLRRFLDREDGRSPTSTRARARIDMGTVLMRTGKPAEACEVVKPALTELDAGISDQRVLIGEVELVRGQCLRMAGDTDGSLAAYRRAVDLHIDTLGENDRRSAIALNNLALGEMYAGRYEDASGHFERALKAFESVGLGSSDHVASLLNNLAALSLIQGRLGEAASYFDRAIRLRQTQGGESAAMGALLSNQARVLALTNHPDEARQAAERGIAMTRQFTGDDSIDTAAVRLAAVDIALWRGKLDDAERELKPAQQTLQSRLGSSHPYTARAELAQAQVAWQHGRRDEADTLLSEANAKLAAAGPTATRYLAAGQCLQAEVLLSGKVEGSREQAAKLAAACLDTRKGIAADSWETYWAEALLSLARNDRAAFVSAAGKVANVLGKDNPLSKRLRALWR